MAASKLWFQSFTEPGAALALAPFFLPPLALEVGVLPALDMLSILRARMLILRMCRLEVASERPKHGSTRAFNEA